MDLASDQANHFPVSPNPIILKPWDLPGNLARSFASLGIAATHSVTHEAGCVQQWRYGEIQSYSGQSVAVRGRWWPRYGSMLGAWWDGWARPLPNDHFQLYYSLPRRCPGYLVIQYGRSGRKTTRATIHAGLSTLEQVARLHRARAILCHAWNRRLSEAVMLRIGFERHQKQLPGFHYIKRLEAHEPTCRRASQEDLLHTSR